MQFLHEMKENFGHLDDLGLTHTIIFCTTVFQEVSGPRRATGSSSETHERDHRSLSGGRNQKTNVHHMEMLCKLVEPPAAVEKVLLDQLSKQDTAISHNFPWSALMGAITDNADQNLKCLSRRRFKNHKPYTAFHANLHVQVTEGKKKRYSGKQGLRHITTVNYI